MKSRLDPEHPHKLLHPGPKLHLSDEDDKQGTHMQFPAFKYMIRHVVSEDSDSTDCEHDEASRAWLPSVLFYYFGIEQNFYIITKPPYRAGLQNRFYDHTIYTYWDRKEPWDPQVLALECPIPSDESVWEEGQKELSKWQQGECKGAPRKFGIITAGKRMRFYRFEEEGKVLQMFDYVDEVLIDTQCAYVRRILLNIRDCQIWYEG
ncbi:hypothetical protein F5Y18DRAFT_440622 [Xylariaceae sp. FL1019]|nr:hypothetical protein F5Y18DRAFT_440622 [Xylariaceae sp. FL1019]